MYLKVEILEKYKTYCNIIVNIVNSSTDIEIDFEFPHII